MIVCSCNRISDAQILAARAAHPPTCHFNAGRAYKSLGCKMKCGRCASTVRALLSRPDDEGCVVTGEACSAHPSIAEPQAPTPAPAYAIAAE